MFIQFKKIGLLTIILAMIFFGLSCKGVKHQDNHADHQESGEVKSTNAKDNHVEHDDHAGHEDEKHEDHDDHGDHHDEKVVKLENHDDHEDHGGHGGHGDHHEEEEEVKGEHGGRLLVKEDFTLELAIFEQGVEPQYRVYGYQDGELVPAKDLEVKVQLKRLGGEVNNFTFTAVGQFLSSDQIVTEPHSFDVKVEAQYQDQSYEWEFESYEGRTTIADQVAKQSEIKIEKVGQQIIKSMIDVRGKILPSEHRIAHIVPRFSGIVKEGKKHIGDPVEKGEVLAIIESNQSLQPYEVRSQIAGTIINGHLIVGEYVPENQWVYIVADLSEVWADFLVPINQRHLIKKGQSVTLTTSDKGSFAGKIYYIAPYLDEKTQSQLIRVIIPNKEGQLLPGMFVTGSIETEEQMAKLAVKNSAIQRFNDWQVVFAKHGEVYEIRPIELGKSDGEWTEVLSGLKADEEYVTTNAFTVKADIMKSGASHDH